MPRRPGFWLDQTSRQLYRVSTHNDWLLDPVNQRQVGVPDHWVRVLNSLDRQCEIDEIRMIGLMLGLIRFRDYRDSLHVQFYASGTKAKDCLKAAADFAPQATIDKFPLLKIQNLFHDGVAQIELSELRSKIQAGESVLQVGEPIPENEALRQRMERLRLANQ